MQNKTSLTPLGRIVSIAAGAFFLMAADGPCNININVDDDDDGDDVECQDLGEVCPNLSCENGNKLDSDGCPICECNTDEVCDPNVLPVPECAFPVFDDVNCTWTCGGGGECFSDADCGAGFFCALSDCGGNGGPEGADCASAGVCIAIAPECFSDADCGAGYICDFSAGVAEPPADGNGDAAPAPPQEGGQCVLVAQTCISDADCPEGMVCELPNAAGALIAIQGLCVEKSEPVPCSIDDDCAAGERCVETCVGDPNCPNCDVCLLTNVCEAVAVSCSSDAECRAGEVCSLPIDGRIAPCQDANNDGVCDDLAGLGVCVPEIIDTGCTADTDCGVGEFCNLSGADCVCPDICEVDPATGDCLPCDCANQPAVGFCDLRSCISDADCGDGLTCEIIGTTGCENVPCEVVDGVMECQPCDPIPVGICVAPVTACASDADCAADEFCAFADAAPPCDANVDPTCAGDRAIVAPQGVCTPNQVDDPCAAVRCGNGAVCVVDAGVATCVDVPADALCTSDADCGAGTVCNAAELCLTDPNCAAGDAACDAVCYGNCVAP